MENASKALLIAGAILLVIAIIAIAVGIVSKTRGAISGAENQIDSMAVQMHNTTLQKFEGNDITYDVVREDIFEILAYNSKQTNDEFKVKICGGIYRTDGVSYSKCLGHSLSIDDAYQLFEKCSYLRSSNSDKIYNIFVDYNSDGIITTVYFIKQRT